jgi:hypothetical protein
MRHLSGTVRYGLALGTGVVALAALVIVAVPSGPAIASTGIKFSRAVVVDQQRPGFEPDVKVDGKGTTYTSVPFGFSTTQSFVWSSADHGQSYQLTPGNVGPGKPATCAGGGDTDLFVDRANNLYFSDLQGLTNISQSVSSDGGSTWTTNCAGVPNTPDDRMWFAGSGTLASNLHLYEDFDATNSSSSQGNQLVETVSTDGVHFLPVVNPNAAIQCPGASPQDCVTNNEGISGNQVVDPASGNIYLAHTTTNGTSSEVGVQVSTGVVSQNGPVTQGTWTESSNLVAPLCPDPSCVDSAGNPEEIAGENFATIARDSAGYLYVTFTAGSLDHTSTDPNFGALTAPERVYVVHSLTTAPAKGAVTWSAPEPISSGGTNTFPWIVAGSNGRVDVAWYHADETSEQGTCASGSGTCTNYGAASLTHAEWSVELGQSLNAHADQSAYTVNPVSEHPVKYGQICTNGLGCVTGGDRSLGDFLQVSIDNRGAALVSYVDDTSADTAAGENAGPEEISHQIGGPSLLASVGSISGPNGGPGLNSDRVHDRAGDAFYSANGSRTPASPNLDLLGASLQDGPNGTLIASIDVKDLSSLTVSPSVGGPDGSWILRWTDVTPGQTGNGHIYYTGMDSNAGGMPTFFDGDTSCVPGPGNPAEHCKYLTYPQTHTVTGAVAQTSAGWTITLTVPKADVGSPASGTTLYSATAFSATSAAAQSATTLFNLIDATTPFDHQVG